MDYYNECPNNSLHMTTHVRLMDENGIQGEIKLMNRHCDAFQSTPTEEISRSKVGLSLTMRSKKVNLHPREEN